jgi:hypothetical protein
MCAIFIELTIPPEDIFLLIVYLSYILSYPFVLCLGENVLSTLNNNSYGDCLIYSVL